MTGGRSTSAVFDAVVIGGSVGGLIAAAYLARAGAKVLLLEQDARWGGQAVSFADGFHAPYLGHSYAALDAQAVRELRLERHGLSFAQRDIALVGLRPDGQHALVPRRGWGNGGRLSERDARAYPLFRKEVLRFARVMRPLWDGSAGTVERLRLDDRHAEMLAEFTRVSAGAYFDRWFESDALKSALGFPLGLSGLSPQEPGSALALLWHFAQESCGVQAAVSQIRGGGGGLAKALVAAAKEAGAEIREGDAVEAIIVEAGRARGIALAGGGLVGARAVVSAFSPRKTLLDLIAPAALGLGAAASVPDPGRIGVAHLVLGLIALPPFAGMAEAGFSARMVIAERPEAAADAKAAALAGRLPKDLILEVTIPSVADPALAAAGHHVLSALIPYLPVDIQGGWPVRGEALRKQALSVLERFAPGLKDRVVAQRLFTPDDIAAFGGGNAEAVSPTCFLAGVDRRVRTPVTGLYLCGRSADMVDCVSGAAGRIAASLALSQLQGART